MKEKFAQTILKNAGLYDKKIDGDFGKFSLEAASKYYKFPSDWELSRIIIGVIQVAAIRADIKVGIIDGKWGNLTQAAYEQLLKLEGYEVKPLEISPIVNVKKYYIVN